MGVLSDAFETACGWALCVVALYALLFANISGNGTLWDSLRGVFTDKAIPVPMNAAVEMRVVPMRPVDKMVTAQNRMLMVPDEPEKEFSVPVLAPQQQPARAADQITDAPADAKAGKDWRKHLTTSFRTFTTYGYGEQLGSASASVSPAQGASKGTLVRAAATPATPATAVSAYRAGVAAQARPGVSTHVSQLGAGASDGVRNIR